MRNKSFIASSLVDRLLVNWRHQEALKLIKPGHIVGDFGCGENATFLKLIEPTIKQGFGFDLSVNAGVETKKIKLCASDLNQPLDFPSNILDIATSFAVIEHITTFNVYVEEINRLLRPGGLLVLTTPAPAADPILRIMGLCQIIDKREIDDHKQYFTYSGLKKLLEKSGFSQVSATSFQFGLNQRFIALK